MLTTRPLGTYVVPGGGVYTPYLGIMFGITDAPVDVWDVFMPANATLWETYTPTNGNDTDLRMTANSTAYTSAFTPPNLQIDQYLYVADPSDAEILINVPAGDYIVDAACGEAGLGDVTAQFNIHDGTGDASQARSLEYASPTKQQTGTNRCFDIRVDNEYVGAAWFNRDFATRGVPITVTDRSGGGSFPRATGIAIEWSPTGGLYPQINYVQIGMIA